MEAQTRQLSMDEMTDLYGGDNYYAAVAVVLGAAILAPVIAPEFLFAAAWAGLTLTWY